MDYRDNPQHRVLQHIKWTGFTPPVILVSKFFGIEANASNFLPSQIDPANIVDIDSDSLTASTGAMIRNETVTLTVAAIVTQVLPNGNLVIHGF